MPTIFLTIGESGAGKSTLFRELDPAKVVLVDADKCHKDWALLATRVEEALATGKQALLSITRGISTFLKYRPDFEYRLYFIDVPLETIIENRQKRTSGRSKAIDPNRIKARIKRLDSIYRNYAKPGSVRGDYDFVADALKQDCGMV